MSGGSLGTVIGVIGAVVALAAFWFAWTMTRNKPTGRVAAMIGALSVSLLAAGVVYAFNRGLSGQPVSPSHETR
jgi:hypothetical protein